MQTRVTRAVYISQSRLSSLRSPQPFSQVPLLYTTVCLDSPFPEPGRLLQPVWPLSWTDWIFYTCTFFFLLNMQIYVNQPEICHHIKTTQSFHRLEGIREKNLV